MEDMVNRAAEKEAMATNTGLMNDDNGKHQETNLAGIIYKWRKNTHDVLKRL